MDSRIGCGMGSTVRFSCGWDAAGAAAVCADARALIASAQTTPALTLRRSDVLIR
jgi:hypothetical protein